MPEPEYFPEVANWYRQDPEYESDTSDIWINENLGLMMRVRVVSGPFGFLTSQYVAEVRDYPSDEPEWEQIGDTVESQGAAKRLAYEYAKEHNDPEE